MFDSLIKKYRRQNSRVFSATKIGEILPFERRIVNNQLGRESEVSRVEQKYVRNFLKPAIEGNSTGPDSDWSFGQRAFEKFKACQEEDFSKYPDLRFILATSNISEILF